MAEGIEAALTHASIIDITKWLAAFILHQLHQSLRACWVAKRPPRRLGIRLDQPRAIDPPLRQSTYNDLNSAILGSMSDVPGRDVGRGSGRGVAPDFDTIGPSGTAGLSPVPMKSQAPP